MTWQLLSMIGPEPAKGFSIMPSAMHIKGAEWIVTGRVNQAPASWIEQYRSTDDAKTWVSEGKVANTGEHAGNPPQLLRLRDGRLVLVYGHRSKPYAIRARLSTDGGKTWGPEITLRDDAVAWDMGYTRSAVRPDGKIVTIYYYNDAPHRERFIAATIWDPGKRR